jgi:hypothetical protein
LSKILDNVLNDAAANETIEKLKEDTKLLNQCLMKKKRNLLLFSLSYFLKNQEKRTNLFLKTIMRPISSLVYTFVKKMHNEKKDSMRF